MIPASPYAITVKDAAIFLSDTGVYDGATGQRFTTLGLQAPSNLSEGQYSVSNGVYTFSAQDAGASVAISYTSTQWSGMFGYIGFSGGVIPSTAPYQITVPNWASDNGVTEGTKTFTNVGGALGSLSAGQYSVSNGTYTFSSADQAAGRTVIIEYSINTFSPDIPVADLTDDDFLFGNKGQDPVVCTRKRPADCYNVVRMEYLDSSLCTATYTIEVNGIQETEQVGQPYPPTIAYVFDQAAIETYGERQESVQSAHFFTTAAAAQTAAQLRLQRIQARNTYKFDLGFRWIILDPMDIVTLTESVTGLNNQWVRIKEISENDNGDLTITAEDYQPGTGTAAKYNGASNGATLNQVVAAPGSVSAPVIFEPPYELSGVPNSLWIAVGADSATWGGCQIWASTDGSTYKFMGTVTKAARLGVTTADFPVGSDPDTSHTLAVDLTASMGVLTAGSQNDADMLNTVALVGSEIISFSACTLTSAFKYSMGTYIRRGQYGTTRADAPSGSRFVRIDDNLATGTCDAANIGKPLYFKFVSFNLFGQQMEDISKVTQYSYTPVGTSAPVATNPVSNSIASLPFSGAGTLISETASLLSGSSSIQVIGSIGGGTTTAGTVLTINLECDGTVISSMTLVASSGGLIPSGSITKMTASPGVGSHVYSLQVSGAPAGTTFANLSIQVIEFLP